VPITFAKVNIMYFRLRNNPSAVIVLSEIYGITSSVRLSCDALHNRGFDTIAPDYFMLPRTFAATEQKAAHDAFLSFGFDNAARYVRELVDKVRPHYRKVFLAGFSAGATTAWICAAGEPRCDGIAAIYGSRIRDYTSLKPQIPSLVIFPEKESSFDVNDMCRVISSSPHVSTRIYEGPHGFADKRSVCYHEGSCCRAHDEISSFFINIR